MSCDLVGVTVDGGMFERGWGQRLISSVWDVPRLTLETLSIDSKSIDLALLPKLMITNVRYVRFLGTPHFTSVSVLLTRTGLFFTQFCFVEAWLSEFDYIVCELNWIMFLVSIQYIMCTLVKLGLYSSLFHLARYYSPQWYSNRFLPVQVTKPVSYTENKKFLLS